MHKVVYWKCILCGNTWPAGDAIEALENYRRMFDVHPNEECHNEHFTESTRTIENGNS